jgi:hypothetical protein
MPSDRFLRRACLRVTLAAALCLLARGSLQAQTTSASVAGSVKDTQGGVLPGATVTLTSNTQGTEQTIVTDGLGNFFFPYVRPDTYTLRITLDGFQSAERPALVVNANDTLAAGSFTLEIGKLEESVTVTGQSPDIQTRSGERGFALQAEAIQNIAVNGRSLFGLIGIVPGVVPGAVQGGGVATGPPTSAAQFSANGQRPNSNNMTIDGVANIDTGDNGGNMATTNLDAVAEFKVLTSSYQAEYGRAVGAQVQVVTKSGTQDFRGSAYWYGRRSAWNANTWLNNRAGTPIPESSRNDMGYTVGGPIYIPGRFNAEKRRLFFFWAQEWQRRKDPVSEVRATVPTALERKGDFSQSVDGSGNPYPYIRDYTTGLLCSASNTAGCFRDGGVLGKIPENRQYAPTLAALNLYPLPNVTGEKGYNYKSQTPSNQPRREELIRVDYQMSDMWRLAGRYMQHSDNQDLPYGAGPNANVDTVEGHNDMPGRNWMVSATGVLNNVTSLELSVGSAHNSADIYTTNQNLTRSAAGMSSLPMIFPDAVQDDTIPTFLYGGGRVASPAYFNLGWLPFTNFNTTYDVNANLTRMLGAHALKAGVYFQKSLKDQSASTQFNGLIYFNNDANNQYDSSHPYANAALGIYQQFQQASVYAIAKWRYTNVEWYLQDNWKIADRLTLDYGVRFYYLTPQWDVSQQASNFLPDEYDPARTVRLYAPAVVNGVRRGYDAVTGQMVSAALIGRVVPDSGDPFNGTFQAGRGIDKTLSSGSKFAVSPRAGFAYDITGTQSLIARGGFAILYDRPQGNTVFNLINNPPGLQVQTLTWGRIQDLATARPLNAPVTLYPTEYDWKVPTVYSWNLGLQVKLPYAFTLDVAYVGSESRNLLQQRPLNAPPYGTAYQASSQDPTRGQTCAGCTPLSSTPGANALPTDFLRPYQGYGAITLWEFGAYSDYKALQTTISRRFDKGLMLSASYTRSQAKGTVNDDFGTARIDGKDREANYGILAIDRPHNFVMSFVYQTPCVASGVLAVLANDWQISGAYLLMSGNPYAISFAIPGITSTNLTGSDQPARVALVGDPGSGWSSDPYRQINTAAFAPPQPGSTGMESPRYFLYAPWVNNLNLSISKSFPLGGRRRFEVRLDAFNALNHTQFASVNSRVDFKSLTDPTITNLPYDADGNLVNMNGFGTVSGVRPPRQLQLVTRFSF